MQRNPEVVSLDIEKKSPLYYEIGSFRYINNVKGEILEGVISINLKEYDNYIAFNVNNYGAILNKVIWNNTLFENKINLQESYSDENIKAFKFQNENFAYAIMAAKLFSSIKHQKDFPINDFRRCMRVVKGLLEEKDYIKFGEPDDLVKIINQVGTNNLINSLYVNTNSGNIEPWKGYNLVYTKKEEANKI